MAKGGMCGEGEGACMAKEDVHGEGGMHGKEGGVHGEGGMHGEGGGMRGMHGRSLRGQYASYWNAFLFNHWFY